MYPALFICHGGGPMPLLDDPSHRPMIAKWKQHAKDIVAKHGKPKAIAVVSAHYQTAEPEVGGAAESKMLYDYYGFPPISYTFQYPAPGAPDLAKRMANALQAGGMASASLNPKRAYDHGVFIPLMAMFPDADIPVVPVCVLASDDPAAHIAMGKALRPFREEGVFFVGSGANFHNFSNFDKRGAGTTFGNALTEALREKPDYTPAQRIDALKKVSSMPGFSEAQPTGAHEHLMPLMTLAGTADGGPAEEVASVPFMLANARHYLFES